MKRGAKTSMQHCQQVSVLLYNIIIFIYIIHIYVSYTYFTVCVCVLMRPWSLMSCVCALVFIYRWGFKPEYTQTHGDLSRWGPKLRSPWVNKLINHTE